jgi:hypothetical protein
MVDETNSSADEQMENWYKNKLAEFTEEPKDFLVEALSLFFIGFLNFRISENPPEIYFKQEDNPNPPPYQTKITVTLNFDASAEIIEAISNTNWYFATKGWPAIRLPKKGPQQNNEVEWGLGSACIFEGKLTGEKGVLEPIGNKTDARGEVHAVYTTFVEKTPKNLRIPELSRDDYSDKYGVQLLYEFTPGKDLEIYYDIFESKEGRLRSLSLPTRRPSSWVKIHTWTLLSFRELEFEAEIEWEPHPAHWGSKSRVSCKVPLVEGILKVSTDAISCLKICEPWQPCQNTIPVGDECKLFKGVAKGLTIWTGSAPMSFDSFTFINVPGMEAIETQLKPGTLTVWIWLGPDAKSIANYYNINNTTEELGSNLITKLNLRDCKELVTIKYTNPNGWEGGWVGQKTHSTCSFVTGILHLLMNINPRKREILLAGSDGLCCFSIQLINHFMNDWKLETNSEESTLTKEYGGSWAFPIADTQCVVKGKIILKLHMWNPTSTNPTD